MRRQPLILLAGTVLVIAIILCVVAFIGVSGRASLRRDLAATQAQLDQAKSDATAAEAAAKRADARAAASDRRSLVMARRQDAFAAALRQAGVDPATIIVTQSPSTPTPTDSPTPSPSRTEAPRSTPSPRRTPVPTCSPLPVLNRCP